MGRVWGCALAKKSNHSLNMLYIGNLGANTFEKHYKTQNEFRPIGSPTQTEDKHCIVHFWLLMGQRLAVDLRGLCVGRVCGGMCSGERI